MDKNISLLTKEELIALYNHLKSKQKYGLNYESENHVDEITQLYNKVAYLQSGPSINNGGQEHVLIEGDNLQGLTALLPTHTGKIGVCYIDPPYGGNRKLTYTDNFVDPNDTWRHSNWLSFMAPRLRLARELLMDSGVIFISIADDEQAQLKLLCDEIFGEENNLGTCINETGGGKNDTQGIAVRHEYVFIYGKTSSASIKKKANTLEKDRLQQLRKWGDNDRREDCPTMYFPLWVNINDQSVSTIEKPGYVKVLPLRADKSDGCWRWSRAKIDNEPEKIVVKAKKNGDMAIYTKSDAGHTTYSAHGSLLKFPTQQGTRVIQDIFGDKVFDYPKPVELIKFLIALGPNNDAVVLDFFAGSGTTGHAVLELNKEDGGNRKFVLINKLNDGDNNDICRKITWERLCGVINGYTKSNGETVSGLPGTLSYLRVAVKD